MSRDTSIIFHCCLYSGTTGTTDSTTKDCSGRNPLSPQSLPKVVCLLLPGAIMQPYSLLNVQLLSKHITSAFIGVSTFLIYWYINDINTNIYLLLFHPSLPLSTKCNRTFKECISIVGTVKYGIVLSVTITTCSLDCEKATSNVRLVPIRYPSWYLPIVCKMKSPPDRSTTCEL